MNLFRVYWVTCAFLIVAAAAEATTIVMPDDGQLIAKSPVIVEGMVTAVDTVEIQGGIWTETRILVTRTLKGTAETEIVLREEGGVIGDRAMVVFGAPEYEAGERVLLFLERTSRGDYRAIDLYVGKFTERHTMDGTRLWFRDDVSEGVTLLDAGLEPLRSKNVQRDAAGFEQFVAERVDGRAGSEGYGIENPVLRDDGTGGSRSSRVSANFSLLGEPAIPRWSKFGSGQTANWHSVGSQESYAGGGVNELQTGIAVWTSDAAARIRYAYAGTRGSYGGLSKSNGVNEVAFNDPLGEITGTFNGSGVVGKGGYISSGYHTFTAPFTADNAHTAGSKQAATIIEGNLTIQDGVTPARGISSSRLAEIIAHELGHTLGFGHSSSSKALMYASLTGLGASLREDDEVAARWLYPGDATALPPPPVVPVASAVMADFDASTLTTSIATPVSFTDRSTGSPTNWSWSFGDGATSTARNPSHAWAGPGTYTVRLTVSNATSSSTASGQITIADVASDAYRTLVSVATQTSGVNGTSWRTELNVFNAGSAGVNVDLIFIPVAGGSILKRSIVLAPRQSATYANALLELFGIGSGAGALAIEGTSAAAGADLRVTSRTFTVGMTGTYGQSVPDVRPEDLQRTLFITGISSNGAFRTNVGLVNRGSTTMAATLTLFARNGAVVSTKAVTLPANSFQQTPLAALFPELSGAHDALTMRMISDAGDAISAYASVVDNATQDPIYVQAAAATSGGSLKIPVVGRSPGVNGTFWRSDVILFNPAGSTITATLRYGGASRQISIPSANTVVVADVLSQFGHASGSGVLDVTWPSAYGPVVTSRTYTSVASGGTYGQSIDPIESLGRRTFVPGLRNDNAYRSNLGFVNGGSEPEVVTATLLSPFGSEIARTTVALGAGQQLQQSLASLFPNASVPAGFTLQVEGDSNAKVFAYASMVDNDSGDPVFFAGR